MLQAFKLANGTLIPFTSVHQAGKHNRDINLLDLIITGKNSTEAFYFSSQKDRDQQLANFEAWLATPTLS